jgi:hypothetical protein
MFAKDIISDLIPPLKPTDKGILVLNWMDEFKVSHLPIVNNKEYLGLISEVDILDNDITNDEIGQHKLSLIRPFVYENQHVYEVIKIISNMKLSVLPVLDEKNEYLGLIPASELLHLFSELAATNEPGGIIVLELNINDFYLSQIAQIVETNDGKILSFYVKHLSDSTKLELTLKLNREDLSGIIQTFNRYNYTIKATYHQKEFKDDMKDRYDSFMNYLNI